MCPIILKSQSTCSCFGISARTSNVDSDMVGIGSNTNMGFTILEMVVSLAIMSILAAVIVTGIVQAVNGFIFIKGTQAVVENAELAMLRLTKELAVTQKSTITGNAASLTFTSLHTGANATYTALLSNSQLTLRDSNNNNYVLANNISALSFAYYDSYNGISNTTWAATRRIVHISITVSGPNNALLIFSTSIAPRN